MDMYNDNLYGHSLIYINVRIDYFSVISWSVVFDNAILCGDGRDRASVALNDKPWPAGGHGMCWWKMLVRLFVAAGVLACGAAYAQTPTQMPPQQLSCRGDRVVWVNTRSGVYHYRGERYFGSTQQGKFVCEKDAVRQGDRPTRSGQ